MNIPGYRIERELAHGGMATVYLAVQESLERQVALKVMAPALAADHTFGERFLKEARTVARLSHPHILAVHDVGVEGHNYYLAMELVPGGDLKQRIRLGALPPQESLAIVRQMALALGYAHEEGFVHRDVKPENILFRKDGTAVLSDFGIAKALGSGTKMTGTGMSIGTPHYMSPEQAQGLSTLDGRSDLYSLGVVLHEILTGQVPYDADNTIGIAMQHVQAPLPQLPSNLGKLQPLLDKLLAKDPAQRYQNSAALVQAIDSVLAGQDLPQTVKRQASENNNKTAATQVMSSTSPASTKGSGLKWAVGGALLAALLIGGVLLTNGGSRPRLAIGGGVSSPVSRPPAASPVINKPQIARPDPSALKKHKIDKLFLDAAGDLQALRLMKPAGNNALEKYRAVLALDAGNEKAQRGIRWVAEKHLGLAKKNLEQNHYAKAQIYLTNAGSIYPGLEGISAMQQRLKKAQHKPQTFTDSTSGMEFKLVKGGCFQMGQSFAEKRYLIKERGKEKYEKYYDDEKPQHEVCVDDLYVARTEVTVGQFRQFIQDTGYRTDAEKNIGGKDGCRVLDADNGKWDWRAGTAWDSPGFSQQDNQPVVCVSWNDSKKYIDWLKRKSGKDYRFATEAEWEYAARGGTDAIRFWGDDPDQACKYANVADQTAWPDGSTFSSKHECDDGHFYPAPVANYRPNPYGLYDMLGNVWEWTNDRYNSSYYGQSPRSNPQGPSTGSIRVDRGGGWGDDPAFVRAAIRYRGGAAYRYGFLGFRLVSSGQ